MSVKQYFIITIASMFCVSMLLGAQTYNKNDSDDKRLSAVTQIDDQVLLAEIAQNDPAAFIRRVAVAKLKDQQLLTKIAQNDENDKVRETARARRAKIEAERIVWEARKDVFESSTKKILFLPPLIKFIAIENDSVLQPDQFQGEDIQTFINKRCSELLKEKGFEILETNITARNSDYEMLTTNISRLFYSQVSDSIANSLKIIGEKYSNTNILAVELKVKIGDLGSWNPINGAITLQNSYSVVRAILLSPQDAQLLWKNKSLFREIPDLQRPTMDEAIEKLFTNLTYREETENEQDSN